MNKTTQPISGKLLFSLGLTFATTSLAVASPVTVSSPDGKVKAELSDTGGRLRYRVAVDNQTVIVPSDLGILSSGVELGQAATLGKPRFSNVNERYRFFGGKNEAVNRARLATVPVSSQGETYEVDVRV